MGSTEETIGGEDPIVVTAERIGEGAPPVVVIFTSPRGFSAPPIVEFAPPIAELAPPIVEFPPEVLLLKFSIVIVAAGVVCAGGGAR